MDIMEIVNKYKRNAADIILIILSLVIANYIYGMHSRDKNVLNDKIQDETDRNNILIDISRDEKNFEALKKVVNKKDLTTVGNNLNTLAKENSVNIVSIKPQNEKVLSEYIKYPYEFSVSGTYHKIGKFISQIESSSDIYMVENLVIRPSESQEKGKSGALTADIRVVTIKIKDKL